MRRNIALLLVFLSVLSVCPFFTFAYLNSAHNNKLLNSPDKNDNGRISDIYSGTAQQNLSCLTLKFNNTIRDTTICKGSNIYYIINASGTDITYQWQVKIDTGFVNIIDNSYFFGAKDDTLLIMHATTGMSGYKYRCIVYSACTMTSITSNTATLYVNPIPVPSFTINNSSQCLRGNNFIFTNNSTGGTQFTWDFGDAVRSTTTSVSYSPSHTYISTGSFESKLIVTNNLNCKDSVMKMIDVRPRPEASFTIDKDTQCLSGNNFQFTNTTVAGINYIWYFGDGSVSAASSPTHSYVSYNNYIVSLVSSNIYGCKDSVTKNVSVVIKPIPSFIINNNLQCLSGNKFDFLNSSVGSKTYLWNFNDGTTSATASPSHTYTAAGTYTVKLISTIAAGCKDSITKTLSVKPQPVSSYTVNSLSLCLNGNNFIFTNTSTGASSYLWNFGDASTSASTSTNHSYTSVNSYNVKLVSVSAFGCKDSNIKTLSVLPHPVSSFTINDNSQCINTNNFIFTNTSTAAATYLWKFGDGFTSSSTSPSHSYTTAGSYSVKLISITGSGCKDSVINNLNVKTKPVAGFNITDTSLCLNANNFIFTNTSSSNAANSWTFGDAGTSTLINPTHSYISVGTYLVKLVALNGINCKDSITKKVYVRPHPVVSFNMSDTSQCFRNNLFSFSSTTTGATTYLWKFGDNTTSSLLSPTHSYVGIGGYSVRLVAANSYGCKDSLSEKLYVRIHPVASFSVNTTSQCFKGNSFSFKNNSVIGEGAFSSLWKFGDNTTSSSSMPLHSYSKADSFVVRLITVSNYGCKDSVSKTVYTRPHPVTGFRLNSNSQCLIGNQFLFTDTSKISSGTYNNYWTFGDISFSYLSSPNHSYASVGSYKVQLITTSNYGCSDSSVTKLMYVRVHPDAEFNINNSNQCLKNNLFLFANNSTISSGTCNFSWSFDDNTYSSVPNPSKTYSAEGSFNVKLIAISDYGCKDTVIKPIYIRPHPVTSFLIQDSAQCFVNNSFVFFSTSVISTGSLTNFWSFGDNSTSTLRFPKINYLKPGTYNVKLLTTSNFGCTDSITSKVYVYPNPVSGFKINIDKQCYRGNVFNFDNISAISSGTIKSLWTFGDGDSSKLNSPSHSYQFADTFTVNLLITSDKGCTASKSSTAIVFQQPNASGFLSNTEVCLPGNEIEFTDNSTVYKDKIAAYNWSFGDGGSSTFPNCSHQYKSEGLYNIMHIVATQQGCIDTFFSKVSIFPQPHASFTVNDTNQCYIGNKFELKNTSTISGGKVNYLWSFGDGSVNTDTDNIHSYVAISRYTVTLTVTSKMNCTDSKSQNVYLKPNPVLNLGSDDTLYGSQSMILKAPKYFDSYLWSTKETTSQIFVDSLKFGSGVKTFWVKVTKNGCDAIDSINIYILKLNSISDPLSEILIRVFPNPVNDKINIEFSSIKREMNIAITDLNGKQLKMINLTPNNSSIIQQINVADLSKGIYLLRISNNENQKVLKFIK